MSTVREGTFELLRRRGIRLVFGNPGSTELGLLARLPADISYVMCLHETVAVTAAHGFAVASRQPAVVNLHAQPGLGNALGAIDSARASRVPIVVTAGQQDTRHLQRRPLLSGPLVEVARPLVKWAAEPGRPEDVVGTLERAFRIAESPPFGPVFVSIPMDFWDRVAGAATFRSTDRLPPLAYADAASIAEWLANAAAAALVAGGALDSPDGWQAARRIVDRLGMDVFAAPMCPRAAFPTSHPRYQGGLRPDAEGMRAQLDRYDAVLLAGGPPLVTYPYTPGPRIPQHAASVLLTDAADDAALFDEGRTYVADVAAALGAITASLPTDHEGSDQESLGRDRRGKTRGGQRRDDETRGVSLDHLGSRLAAHSPPGTVFVDEAVSSGNVMREHLPVAAPGGYMRSASGWLGFALSASIGAQLARPDATVLVLVGDGAFMYAPQALWTIAQHRLPVRIVVLNNSGYQILKDFSRMVFPEIPTLPSLELSGIDYRRLGESMGVSARDIADDEAVDSAVSDMFESTGPFLLNVDLTPPRQSAFDRDQA